MEARSEIKVYSRWRIQLLILLMVLQLFLLFIIARRNFQLMQIAWTITDWSPNRYEIETVTIDGIGDPWYIDRTLFFNQGYQLRHVTDKKTESWDLPSITFEEALFSAVMIGKGNQPWLLLGKRLAHFDGNQWIFLTTPFDAEIHNYLSPSIAFHGPIVWGIDNASNGTRLIRLDLSQEPIQTQEILLPNGLDEQQFKFDCIVPVEDNNLLAIISNNVEVDFYYFQNHLWKNITSFVKTQSSNIYVNDIAVSSDGQIWIVLTDWIRGKHIGKFDPREGSWKWLEIEHTKIADREFEYEQIAIDALGRVWLSAVQLRPKIKTGLVVNGEQDNLVYTPEYNTIGVYNETRDDKLVEVRHYTTANSSLENNRMSRVLLGPDGRIWTWDRQLAWMDSQKRDLPLPLPEWIVFITNQEILLPIMVFILILLVSLIILRQLFRRRAGRKAN